MSSSLPWGTLKAYVFSVTFFRNKFFFNPGSVFPSLPKFKSASFLNWSQYPNQIHGHIRLVIFDDVRLCFSVGGRGTFQSNFWTFSGGGVVFRDRFRVFQASKTSHVTYKHRKREEVKMVTPILFSLLSLSLTILISYSFSLISNKLPQGRAKVRGTDQRSGGQANLVARACKRVAMNLKKKKKTTGLQRITTATPG